MKILAAFSVCMLLITAIFEQKKKKTKDSFLVANRKINGLFAAFSIAASWIWAPALLVSTQTGFQYGLSGLLWFVIPNCLSLIFFAYFARIVRQKAPFGYSYINYLKSDKIFKYTQTFVHLFMQIIIFALQVTAGAEILSHFSNISYEAMAIAMTITTLSYSLIGGMRSSIITDFIQYLIILVVIFILYFNLNDFSLKEVITAKTINPFDENLLLEFGISSAIGLFFAIFADQQQWQRIFSIKQNQILKTYFSASLLHGIITTGLGIFGCYIYYQKFSPLSMQIVGFEYITKYLPSYLSPLFVLMILSGLCSTLDSALCAFSSIYATEISKSDNYIQSSRNSMVFLAVLGLAISLFKIPIITLWFFASTIRLSSFYPTLKSITSSTFNSKSATLSIILSFIIGGSIFIVGIVVNNQLIRTTGMIATLLSSFIFANLSKIK